MGAPVATRRGRACSWPSRPATLLLSTLLWPAHASADPPSGDHTFTLTTPDGRERSYVVHVPPSYDPATPASVVLTLHGGGGDAEATQTMTGMSATADAHGFLAVYPEGIGPLTKDGHTLGTWNAGRCCGAAMEEGVDDVAYLSQLIDALEHDFNVDPRRIYATGISNGSQMSFRLACELSNRIAAVAPTGSQPALDDCHPSRPVPVWYFHGRRSWAPSPTTSTAAP